LYKYMHIFHNLAIIRLSAASYTSKTVKVIHIKYNFRPK